MPNRRISKLDLPIAGMIPGGAASVSTDDITPPPLPVIAAPYHLTLTTAAEYSGVTPTAQIGAAWYPPDGVSPSAYVLQWDTSSTFTAPIAKTVPAEIDTIGGLPVGTLYYVRVAAIVAGVQSVWSDSSSITTATDTTAPGVPTSAAASFAGVGDLVVTWTNATSANLRATEIKIWASSAKATLYATLLDATGRRVWTAAENMAATSNAGDPVIYVELRSLGYNGLYSSAVVVGTITKTAPSAPGTIAHSWTGDTGAAGADWTISWAAQADVEYYLLAINGLTARRVYGTTYTYTLDRNIADNTSADPTLSYSLIAVDGLAQSSTAATGTATNAAPAAPTVTLAGSWSLVCQVTSAPAADFLAFEYVWKRDGSTVRTLESAASSQSYELSDAADAGSHSWTCTVRQKDAFGQYSTGTASSAVVLDVITIGYLRAGLIFSDSDANTQVALTVLKDDVRGAGGISYAA